MARPARPQTVVKNKLLKKFDSKLAAVRAKKRKAKSRAIAKIKTRYTNLG